MKMSSSEKSKKLRAEAPEEIGKFIEAAQIIKEMSGLSASITTGQRDEVSFLLSFSPKTDIGRELKDEMLKRADSYIPEDGMFFID